MKIKIKIIKNYLAAWNSKTLNRIAKIIGYGLLRVCLREEKLSWNYELSYLGAVNFNNELTTWQMILSVGNSPPVQATQWWIYKSITRNACVFLNVFNCCSTPCNLKINFKYQILKNWLKKTRYPNLQPTNTLLLKY